MNILGISGSLRKGSSNMAILHAMARHVPKNVPLTLISSHILIPI